MVLATWVLSVYLHLDIGEPHSNVPLKRWVVVNEMIMEPEMNESNVETSVQNWGASLGGWEKSYYGSSGTIFAEGMGHQFE